ncbi:MAG: aminopeptidase P family protein [Bacteroidales bacterium]
MVKDNIEALRQAMRSSKVDAVVIPKTDPHQSEYLCEYWDIVKWLTGFTGSNATVVVAADAAGLWTDSRYYLQAEQELEGSDVVMYREDSADDYTVSQWIAANAPQGGMVAINGYLFSVAMVNAMDMFCGGEGFMLAVDFNPYDRIWTNRPALPSSEVYIHDVEFAGECAENKIARVLESLDSADALIITSLDEIAWTLNIRGADIAYNPLVVSYLYISEDRRVLFIDSDRLTAEVKDYLKGLSIQVLPYDGVTKFIKGLSYETTLMIDPEVCSDALARRAECGIVYSSSPIKGLKAVKNSVQLDGVREAVIRDGISLVELYIWLESGVVKGEIRESDVATKYVDIKSGNKYYKGESFGMICGYGDNGAIVHYSAKSGSDKLIEGDNLLLIDCGSQYLDATTDITRTVSLGSVTQQQRKDYTLVLKGHLAIGMQSFPVGTRGAQLDALARQFLWREGLAYFHGTGHGIGSFLGVHEGPQSIRLNENPTPLEVGMILSNEPGLYRQGEYGIRIENMVSVCEGVETQFGRFLEFETLSLFPYDKNLIVTEMLTDDELDWVNIYHQRVMDTLSPYLSVEAKEWLADKTEKLIKK